MLNATTAIKSQNNITNNKNIMNISITIAIRAVKEINKQIRV